MVNIRVLILANKNTHKKATWFVLSFTDLPDPIQILNQLNAKMISNAADIMIVYVSVYACDLNEIRNLI